jgi:hypothetical protein
MVYTIPDHPDDVASPPASKPGRRRSGGAAHELVGGASIVLTPVVSDR